jgi:hypothetical protein
MTKDQIAQIDLLIARIAFYKEAAKLFQSFLHQEWPDPLITQATTYKMADVMKDVRAIDSFKQVIHSFGEFYFSKAIDLELDLRNKRRQFEETGKGLTN